MSEESKKEKTIILPGDYCVRKEPIFTSGITISCFTKQDDPVTPFLISRVKKCYEIKFQCEGDAADAFMHEFLKLSDKYNHWEMCYYHPEVTKKETWFEKIKNIMRMLFTDESILR